MTRFSKPAARLRTLPPPLCECDGCAELSPHRSGARNGRIGWLMCTVPQIIFSHWLGPQLGTRSPITELVWHTGHRNLCGDEVESHLSAIIWSESDYKDINSDCENILCASASYISPLCNTFYFRWNLCWFPPLRENFACLIAWPAPWRRGQDSS